jgi:hypothetical protein
MRLELKRRTRGLEEHEANYGRPRAMADKPRMRVRYTSRVPELNCTHPRTASVQFPTLDTPDFVLAGACLGGPAFPPRPRPASDLPRHRAPSPRYRIGFFQFFLRNLLGAPAHAVLTAFRRHGSASHPSAPRDRFTSVNTGILFLAIQDFMVFLHTTHLAAAVSRPGVRMYLIS